ncbi:hypothetical protein EZV62_013096 [Acer yangbiense]|uniref:Senescence-associated protein n=1 Tax=Acer yangbiense TaxID=1000413 RepID=A0A5C7HX74_9ROSI|nr:hypothetical protein EZV62_013096 [Acer yangbiense]
MSHDGLNPAHVPYWWVNNPTLGEFCFTMIGRADIEGSKTNVAMNAWLPQASYPCGNFSDTSSFKFRRSKGSIGHAFTIRIHTENQNQTSFYPFVPLEISILVELILGHLRYLLTDVPPQPNSPPDNVFRPDQLEKTGLGSKKRGSVPLPIHGISKITLKVVRSCATETPKSSDPSPPRHLTYSAITVKIPPLPTTTQHFECHHCGVANGSSNRWVVVRLVGSSSDVRNSCVSGGRMAWVCKLLAQRNEFCGRGITTSIRPSYYAFVNRHERLPHLSWLFIVEWLYNVHASVGVVKECCLVDPASSHMLVSKIKPCMCRPVRLAVCTGRLVPSAGDALLA